MQSRNLLGVLLQIQSLRCKDRKDELPLCSLTSSASSGYPELAMHPLGDLFLYHAA